MIGVGLELAPEFHHDAVETSVIRLPLAIEDATAKIFPRLGISLMGDELDQEIAFGGCEGDQRAIRR